MGDIAIVVTMMMAPISCLLWLAAVSTHERVVSLCVCLSVCLGCVCKCERWRVCVVVYVCL
jgi:hypothetical protein